MNIIKEYLKQPNPIKRKALAEQAYLLFYNDFLSTACFTEYHETDVLTARNIINEGRKWNQLPKIEAMEEVTP